MAANEAPDAGPRRKGQRARTADRSPGSGKPDREYVGAGFIGGVVVLLVLGILLVALIAQNADQVPFRLLWLEADIPLAALLLGTAVAAILLSELVGLIWRRRRRTYRTLQESRGA